MNPLRWLGVSYRPDVEAKGFLDRIESQTDEGVEAHVAVLSDQESRQFFGVRIAKKGIQPVWVRIVNGTDHSMRLDQYKIDPQYFTPLEAAYINHFSVGRRLAGYGILTVLFLHLLLLIPFKLIGARWANRRMDQLFKKQGLSAGPIRGHAEKEGFVFTSLDEGVKHVEVQLIGNQIHKTFSFAIDVPGLVRATETDDQTELQKLQKLQETGLDDLREWIRQQPRSTSNRLGTKEGDPLNLVVVGNRDLVTQCFGAQWDEVETINFSTCLKTTRAFLLDSEYRYSPVSSLFLEGQPQQLALQKARGTINERIHLRLWPTTLAHDGQQVWVGQISRDIGVRFTLKTWNMTTHKIDPDVDEARDYLLGSLLAVGRVSQLGYVEGVEAADESSPRRNLTGDPYYTDGLRAVMILSRDKIEPAILNWV